MNCLEYWVLLRDSLKSVIIVSTDTKRRWGGWMDSRIHGFTDSRRRKLGAAQTGCGATSSILVASLFGLLGNVLAVGR